MTEVTQVMAEATAHGGAGLLTEQHGDFEQVGWVLAGMDRAQTAPAVRDATVTDTDALLREVGFSDAEIAALREEGVAA